MLDLVPKTLIAIPGILLAIETVQELTLLASAPTTGTAGVSCPPSSALQIFTLFSHLVICASCVSVMFVRGAGALKSIAMQTLVFSGLMLVNYIRSQGLLLDDIFGLNIQALDKMGFVLFGMFFASLFALMSLGSDVDDVVGGKAGEVAATASGRQAPSFTLVNFLTFSCIAAYTVGLLILSSKRKAMLTRSFPGAGTQCIKDAGEDLSDLLHFDMAHLAGLLSVLHSSSPSAYRLQGFVTLLSGSCYAAVIAFLFRDVRMDQMVYIFNAVIAVHFIFSGLVLLLSGGGRRGDRSARKEKRE